MLLAGPRPDFPVSEPSRMVALKTCTQSRVARAVMVSPIAGSVRMAAGKWMVKLGSFPAGGPHEMKITQGAASSTLKNIVVGEVCPSRSNTITVQ